MDMNTNKHQRQQFTTNYTISMNPHKRYTNGRDIVQIIFVYARRNYLQGTNSIVKKELRIIVLDTSIEHLEGAVMEGQTYML